MYELCDFAIHKVIAIFARMVATCLSILVVVCLSFPPFLLAAPLLGWFYLRSMKCIRWICLLFDLTIHRQTLSTDKPGAETIRCDFKVSHICCSWIMPVFPWFVEPLFFSGFRNLWQAYPLFVLSDSSPRSWHAMNNALTKTRLSISHRW